MTLPSPAAGPRGLALGSLCLAPRLLTDGPGDGQGPVDSPAVHVRHEAAQRFDALLLILQKTVRVGPRRSHGQGSGHCQPGGAELASKAALGATAPQASVTQ